MLKKHRPKNVQKSTEKRTKNGPRGLPGASPGPPWGLPGASRGHFRGHATQREKTRKTKRLSGPHFSEKREIYRPRLDPEIAPEWPQERKNKWKTTICLMPRWGWPFWAGFSIDFPSIFRVFSMRCFSHCSTVSKNGKVLKTLQIAIRTQGRHYRKNKKY